MTIESAAAMATRASEAGRSSRHSLSYLRHEVACGRGDERSRRVRTVGARNRIGAAKAPMMPSVRPMDKSRPLPVANGGQSGAKPHGITGIDGVVLTPVQKAGGAPGAT